MVTRPNLSPVHSQSWVRAIGSAVERLVHTEEVTGSIPVSPTRSSGPVPSGAGPELFPLLTARHHGRVDPDSSERGSAVGTVVLLRRFPLKSAGGELPDHVDVDADGVVGDRAWAVVDDQGAPLRTRDHPWLADLTGRAVAGRLRVGLDGPDPSGPVLTGPALREALSRRAGRPVDLAPAPAPGDGAAPVHVISEHAERDPGAPTDCDLGHRANLVLAMAPGRSPGEERTWVGARLRVGGAELLLTRTPRRCLGVYADVVRPGRVAIGDRAVLLP